MKTVIFDIDGTLADLSHRIHLIEKEPKDWDKFRSLAMYDAPIGPMVELCQALMRCYRIVFVTGRKDTGSNRKNTLKWLRTHVLVNGISNPDLFMRLYTDHRPDYVIKAEVLSTMLKAGHEIAFVVEDRKSVVDMWREKGIMCLQCAPGDF